ncbi:hypothetical protein BO94DRAFT_354100 [Aspergillus sclerotioniger CBS 115572]|uniref:Uncharacterized protein n=1 Tax=Aspergillus sclerotioniger CBS 115572 TaxID=1450535 RepID=A0A317X5I1_9EURO|nr:hypothetical protein BO94DRAFT_354100 [Aspergillus sclerotioniger CBS 115572]PWY93823.1 hypothetical protein BO94DRAFT_354100 [Aspergillus sclerotioniger CBS 115572]
MARFISIHLLSNRLWGGDAKLGGRYEGYGVSSYHIRSMVRSSNIDLLVLDRTDIDKTGQICSRVEWWYNYHIIHPPPRGRFSFFTNTGCPHCLMVIVQIAIIRLN